MARTIRLPQLVALSIIFAAAYYAGAFVSVRIARLPEANWTVIWLSSGVGLLCVRAIGRVGLAAVGAAALATSTVYYAVRLGLPWPRAAVAILSTAALDVLQVWMAAKAERRIGNWGVEGWIEGAYARLASYLLWVCLLPPLLTCSLLVVKDPLLGIGSLSADGSVAGVLMKVFIVATGNALGLFLLGPLTLLWERRQTLWPVGSELLLMLFLVPFPVLLSTVTIPHVAILAFAVALMVAVRHGLAGSVLAVLVLTLSTVAVVVGNAGPFPIDQAGMTMFGFALVIVVLGVTFHFVGLAVDALAYQQANLEQLVAARTQALERKSAELAALAERKTTFLAWLSHEVRTPLNAMLGMVRLMLRDGPTPDHERRLGIAETAGRYLVRLLDDVLELSRMEAEVVTLAPEPVDPRAVIGEVLTILQPEAAAKGLRLTVAIGAGLHPVYEIDPLRLRQLLFNLIANAIKFTDSGMIVVRLAKEERHDGSRLVLEVEDTGPGVPEDARDSIFDAYARTEGRGARSEGAGLGLAIVRQVMERMEGTVGVTTGRHGGALFRLSFPAVPVRVEPFTPKPARSRAGKDGMPTLRNGLSPAPPMDILLVEDGPENRLVILEWLAPGGHRITCATSGEEALRVAAERPFDLILMDIRLDGMDGVEATRRIRALPDEALALTPIVALTANASRRDRDEYTAAGIDEVLTKPINPDALADALARHAPSGGFQPAPREELPAGDAAGKAQWLTSLFIVVARSLDAALSDAQKAGDLSEIERIAHRLHGSAGTYGHQQLADAAAVLEREARRGADDERLGAAVAEVRSALTCVMSAATGTMAGDGLPRGSDEGGG